MLGYSAAEVVNRINPSDIHDPEEVRKFIARYRRSAAAVCEHPDRPIGEALARA